MKSSIVGSVIAVLIIITFITIGSIQINENISNEVNETLNNAIYTTQRTIFDKRTEIDSNEKYLEVFNADMKKQLKNNNDIKYSVNVLGIDYKKGLLDVEINAKYKNLLGIEKTEKVRKTMIIEKATK